MIPLLFLPALFSTASLAFDAPPPCVDEAAVLEETERAFPSRYRDLMALRDTDPDRFARMLHNTYHELDDPEQVALMEKLDNAQDRLARASAAWNKAPEAQRPPLDAEIEVAATAVIDLTQALRREHATHLRDALSDLTDEIKDADVSRDADIQQQIEKAEK